LGESGGEMNAGNFSANDYLDFTTGLFYFYKKRIDVGKISKEHYRYSSTMISIYLLIVLLINVQNYDII
jgi:hypothetical protein